VPDENTGRHIEDTVIGVELLDCCTTAAGVAFTKNLLERASPSFLAGHTNLWRRALF
jgi:hypothetical protein